MFHPDWINTRISDHFQCFQWSVLSRETLQLLCWWLLDLQDLDNVLAHLHAAALWIKKAPPKKRKPRTTTTETLLVLQWRPKPFCGSEFVFLDLYPCRVPAAKQSGEWMIPTHTPSIHTILLPNTSRGMRAQVELSSAGWDTPHTATPSPPTDPQPHPAIWRPTEIKSQWRWMILRLTCTAAFIMCHVFPVLQDRTHCWLNAKKPMPIKHLNAFLTGN